MTASSGRKPGSASGPNTLAPLRGSMRHCLSALERWNNSVPAQPQAAANSTAAAGEGSATKKATSTGPRIKISSISTDSSEYAVDSRASPVRRGLKNVRMHTVMGGKHAPAVAANVKAIQRGAGAERAATSPASADGKARAQESSVGLGP